MLTLGKKIDYALISLVWLGERPDQWVSAREIAEANSLPLPALMQILKALHHHGVLESTRGVKGGYQIGCDLETLTLHELSEMLDSVESEPSAGQAPVEKMREKLAQFLRDVRVSEVVTPGRRIDVPLHRLRVTSSSSSSTKEYCPCPSP